MDTSGLELSGFDEPECAGAMQAPQVSATGTYEFRADGTMSFDVTMSMQMSVVLGAACFEALGGVALTSASCLELEAAMNDPDPGSSIESVSCTFSGGVCRCNMQRSPEVLQGDGPYTNQGTSFVDPDGDRLGYCVSGDTLRLYPPDSSGIFGTIVLGRR